MSVSNKLQVVHFQFGKETYKLNVPQEISKKLLEDKEFAVAYLKQMVKQQNSSSKGGLVNDSVKKRAATQGQISLLQIPITISSEETSLAHQQWPIEAAKLLLQEYKSKMNEFNGGVRKKKDIWADIHQHMRTYGFAFSQENCEKKFRNMKASYLAIRGRNMKLGRNTSKWEFYDEMEEIFGASHSQGVSSVGPGSSISDHDVKGEITVLADGDSVPQLVSDDEHQDVLMENEKGEEATMIHHFNDEDNNTSFHCHHYKQSSEPPVWFSTFLKQFQEIEERKLDELKKIHQDNVQLLRQRNELLERLNQTIDKMIQ